MEKASKIPQSAHGTAQYFRTQSTNVHVAIRLRPLLKDATGPCPLSIATNGCDIIDTTRGITYTLDAAFNETQSTEDVFKSVVKPIVDSCLEGFNGTVFAYGQTCSGKTHTMQGGDGPGSEGIIFYSVQDIFRHIQSNPTRNYLISLTYIEVYNETLIDLFQAASESSFGAVVNDDESSGAVFCRKPMGTSVKGNKTPKVTIAETADGQVEVRGVKVYQATSFEEVMTILRRCEKARHVAGTQLNERSSRSHSILTLRIESKDKLEDLEDTSLKSSCQNDSYISSHENVSSSYSLRGSLRVGLLNLVDLAGSEGVSRSQTEGLKRFQGSKINQSLLALSRVISQIVQQQQRAEKEDSIPQHITYRNSKLTRLLSNSLGGNSKTLIICCCSPELSDYRESISTLEFASRAKCIRNKAKVNVYELSDVQRRETETSRCESQEDSHVDDPFVAVELDKSRSPPHAIESQVSQNLEVPVYAELRVQKRRRRSLQMQRRQLEKRARVQAGLPFTQIPRRKRISSVGSIISVEVPDVQHDCHRDELSCRSLSLSSSALLSKTSCEELFKLSYILKGIANTPVKLERSSQLQRSQCNALCVLKPSEEINLLNKLNRIKDKVTSVNSTINKVSEKPKTVLCLVSLEPISLKGTKKVWNRQPNVPVFVKPSNQNINMLKKEHFFEINTLKREADKREQEMQKQHEHTIAELLAQKNSEIQQLRKDYQDVCECLNATQRDLTSEMLALREEMVLAKHQAQEAVCKKTLQVQEEIQKSIAHHTEILKQKFSQEKAVIVRQLEEAYIKQMNAAQEQTKAQMQITQEALQKKYDDLLTQEKQSLKNQFESRQHNRLLQLQEQNLLTLEDIKAHYEVIIVYNQHCHEQALEEKDELWKRRLESGLQNTLKALQEAEKTNDNLERALEDLKEEYEYHKWLFAKNDIQARKEINSLQQIIDKNAFLLEEVEWLKQTLRKTEETAQEAKHDFSRQLKHEQQRCCQFEKKLLELEKVLNESYRKGEKHHDPSEQKLFGNTAGYWEGDIAVLEKKYHKSKENEKELQALLKTTQTRLIQTERELEELKIETLSLQRTIENLQTENANQCQQLENLEERLQQVDLEDFNKMAKKLETYEENMHSLYDVQKDYRAFFNSFVKTDTFHEENWEDLVLFVVQVNDILWNLLFDTLAKSYNFDNKDFVSEDVETFSYDSTDLVCASLSRNPSTAYCDRDNQEDRSFISEVYFTLCSQISEREQRTYEAFEASLHLCCILSFYWNKEKENSIKTIQQYRERLVKESASHLETQEKFETYCRQQQEGIEKSEMERNHLRESLKKQKNERQAYADACVDTQELDPIRKLACDNALLSSRIKESQELYHQLQKLSQEEKDAIQARLQATLALLETYKMDRQRLSCQVNELTSKLNEAQLKDLEDRQGCVSLEEKIRYLESAVFHWKTEAEQARLSLLQLKNSQQSDPNKNTLTRYTLRSVLKQTRL